MVSCGRCAGRAGSRGLTSQRGAPGAGCGAGGAPGASRGGVVSESVAKAPRAGISHDKKPGISMIEEELASAVAGCEGLIVRIAPITRRVIESATALRVIEKHGRGGCYRDGEHRQDE